MTPILRRRLLPALGTLVLAAAAIGHGVFEKRLWNAGKANRATRGGTPGTKPTKLFMMQPQQYLTGTRQAVAFSAVLQDEEAATQELCKLSYVKYAGNGRDPDTTPAGEIGSVQFRLFGFGMQGTVAREFTLTLGKQLPLPHNYGLAIQLPGNAKWPRDGASIHAQLNLPNDSRRPRIPAPHDKQIWAFEQPGAAGNASPLGGRVLDILNITGQYTEPVLQFYVRTKAYGLGYEQIWGPEAYHPSAARGDEFGLFLDGGIPMGDGFAAVFLSPRRAKTPIPFPPGRSPAMYFYLDITAPLIPFAVQKLNSIGSMGTEPMPVAKLPKELRSFWMQAVMIEPKQKLTEVSGAVQLRGQ